MKVAPRMASRAIARRLPAHLSCVALGVCLAPAAAAAASLTYSDGVCAYRVAYDPAKIDGARLKATFDHLADPGPPRELAEQLTTQDEIAASDVAAYRARCAAHHARLAGLRLVDQPGIEALRKAELAELDGTCSLAEASLAVAKGDLERDLEPARTLAPACLRYTDLLALPPERLKARWNDLVVDLCTTSTEPSICAGHLQRAGEGPGAPARRRIAVVDRWAECAARSWPDLDGERERLRTLFARRFKAKALSCAR